MPMSEVQIECVNGWGGPRTEHLTSAEHGIWKSTVNMWEWSAYYNEELIVFEDDAIVSDNFMQYMVPMYGELPHTYDYMALWVPEDQRQDYYYDAHYDAEGHLIQDGPWKNDITSNYNFGGIRICRLYQGYGNVATMYSPRGASKLLNLARTDTPVDCWLHLQSHLGRVEAYAPKPMYANFVAHNWDLPTTIHTENI